MLNKLAVLLVLLGSLGSASLLGFLEALGAGQSEWVELDHGSGVLQGVALTRTEGRGLLGAEGGLNFVGVDDSANVSGGEDSRRNTETRLDLGVSLLGSEDGVKGLESRLGPDDKTTDVTTRGELEEVKTVDVAEIQTLDVAEGSDKGIVSTLLVVDEERASTLDITSVSGLTLTSADGVGVSNTFQVSTSSEGLEEGNSFLGLGDRVNVNISDYQRNFSNLLNAVTTGQNKRGKRGGREGRASGITTLSLADLDVPSSPYLSSTKHTTTTAHVTEGTLTRSVCTSTSNTRDTRHSSTSSPTLSRGLLTSKSGYSVWLTMILVHASVDADNKISTDGGSEDGREGGGALLFSLKRLDGNKGSRRLHKHE